MAATRTKRVFTRKQTPADINLELVLGAINDMRETNTKSHNDIRELIHEGLKGVQLIIDSNAQVTNDELRRQNDHFATLNGSVGKLKTESDDRKQTVLDFRRLELEFCNYKKRWPYFVAGIAFITLVLLVVYDLIGLRGILGMIP